MNRRKLFGLLAAVPVSLAAAGTGAGLAASLKDHSGLPEPGDVVTWPARGSMLMTVEKTFDHFAMCVWWNGEEYTRGIFSFRNLEFKRWRPA